MSVVLEGSVLLRVMTNKEGLPKPRLTGDSRRVDQSGDDHRITLGVITVIGVIRVIRVIRAIIRSYEQYIGIEGEALSFNFVFNSIVNLIS